MASNRKQPKSANFPKTTGELCINVYPHTTAHHELDVVTSMSFSNVARTPSAGEHRSQSSATFVKSPDIPHPGCKISSSQSAMSMLPKSPLLAADRGNNPLKSTSAAGSNMSIRGPSAGKVRRGRFESPLYHSMPQDTSPVAICLDAADAMLSGGNTVLLLLTPAAAGR